MEWLMMNAYGANAFGENLGYYLDDSYIVADECEDTLEEMLQQLRMEDPIQRQFRRQLALMEVMQRDLVPLLMNLDFEQNENAFYLLVNVLADLSQPSECLQEAMLPPGKLPTEPQGGHKIQELSKLLNDIKQPFLKEDVIKRLFVGIFRLARQESSPTEDQCRAVVHFFYLMRNILYSSNNDTDGNDVPSNHFFRMRNLLACGLGDILITFLTVPQWDLFSGVCVQLLSVIFKDQVNMYENKQTMDSIPCQDSTLGEGSSCQAESNIGAEAEGTTEGQGQKTGDSAEKPHLSSVPELVCVIQCMENLLSAVPNGQGESSCAGESPPSKVPCPKHHHLPGSPTLEEPNHVLAEIRSHLIEFTMTFLEKAFTQLVLSLLNRNATSNGSIDETYFTWMAAYFLTFARKRRVEFNYIRVVFLHEVVGMIVYQGLKNWTKLLQSGSSCQGTLKRLHLVVTTIKEMFKCLRMHSNSGSLDEDSRQAITMIKYDLATMKDLRQFLLFSLRSYTPGLHSVPFLRDLIKTNHLMLQLMDECLRSNQSQSFHLIDHVQQFGSKIVMRNYGLVLSNFEHNSPNMNTAILTMMHHISGDCGKASTLLQHDIVNTFIQLCDSMYPLTVEVNDLIEYVFKTFIECMQNTPRQLAENLFSREELEDCEFSEEEKDQVISLYMESVDGEDVAQAIAEKLKPLGVQKNALQVSNLLSSLGYLSNEDNNGEPNEDSAMDESTAQESDESCKSYDRTVIRNYVDKLSESGLRHALKSIQSHLLDVCFSKLVLSGLKLPSVTQTWEPLSFYSLVKNEDIPLLHYSDEDAALYSDSRVKNLLASLQFRLPCSSHDYYYIPCSWDLEELWYKAELLAPIKSDDLKFTTEEVHCYLSKKKRKFTDVKEDYDSGVSSMGSTSRGSKMFWPAAVSRINRNLSSAGSDSFSS